MDYTLTNNTKTFMVADIDGKHYNLEELLSMSKAFCELAKCITTISENNEYKLLYDKDEISKNSAINKGLDIVNKKSLKKYPDVIEKQEIKKYKDIVEKLNPLFVKLSLMLYKNDFSNIETKHIGHDANRLLNAISTLQLAIDLYIDDLSCYGDKFTF